MKILLEIKNLKFKINNKEILKDINLKIREKETHSLLGVNGTGKSTIGNIIMGLSNYRNIEGEIIYKNEKINKLSIFERAKKGITLASQIPPSFEGITVREYLNIGRKNKEISIQDALVMVGLDPDLCLNRVVDENLSGGERKRIELASILMLTPEFVILDEPDSGIDFLSIQDIINYIHFLNKNGSTILLITHREEISHIADRTSLICNGIILTTGKPMKVSQYFKTHCENCMHKNKPVLQELKNEK